MGFEERADCLRGNVAATGKGDMGMERAQIGLETRGERGFLHAFVQLKQMRMAGADTDPNNFRPTFTGKCSQADDRKEKGFPGDRSQLSHQAFLSFARNV